MVDTRVKPTVRKSSKKGPTQTANSSARKKAAPARRSRSTRSKRPGVAVVVLSGSTPLRRNKAAELVAEELKLDLSKVDLSSVVSRREGESEKNINRVFDDAERSGSILFSTGRMPYLVRAEEVRVSMRMPEQPTCSSASRTIRGSLF